MVVDYFSKKVWARPLTGSAATEGVNAGGVPQPEEVLEQFTNICQCIHTTPRELITDNGSDFVNQNFNAFCNAQHIKHITTSSHTPESNGLVERMNKTMRDKITAGIAHFNELNWSAHLQDYVININSQRHIKGKYSADELWTRGYNEPNYNHNRVELNRQVDDHSPTADLREHHKAQMLHQAYDQVVEPHPDTSHVGDHVRIRLSAYGPFSAELPHTTSSKTGVKDGGGGGPMNVDEGGGGEGAMGGGGGGGGGVGKDSGNESKEGEEEGKSLESRGNYASRFDFSLGDVFMVEDTTIHIHTHIRTYSH